MIRLNEVKRNFLKASVSLVTLSILIFAVSFYFIENSLWIGSIFIFLGFMSLIILKHFDIKIISVYPDIVFGAIDNGVLILTAIFGGEIAGVAGAVVGGAAGNAVTDGIGGLFEGYISEKEGKKTNFEKNRTSISSSLGKVAGCLFGAGVAMLIIELIKIIWFMFISF